MSTWMNPPIYREGGNSRHVSKTIWLVVSIVICSIYLNVNTAKAVDYNLSGDNLTVNSGTYDHTTNGFLNEGTLTVDPEPGSSTDPEFNHDTEGLFNDGIASIAGGSFNDDSFGIENDNGTVTVTGGEFEDNSNFGVYNSGTATISGGTFVDNDYGLYNVGVATVSSGSFQINGNNGSYGLYNYAGSTLTVSGGTYLSDGEGFGYAIENYGDTFVTGGTFGNSYDAIINVEGATDLTGGSFSGNAVDLDVFGGTVDVFGTAFTVNGKDPFGNLSGGGGSFTWTQANGSIQTLSYDIYGGSIDLIKVAAAPESSTSVSFGILSAIFLVFAVYTRVCSLVNNRRNA